MAADTDGDGGQEIITGQTTIDSAGTLKCQSGMGHGDAMDVTELVPGKGISVFSIHEGEGGMDAHDGATCSFYFKPRSPARTQIVAAPSMSARATRTVRLVTARPVPNIRHCAPPERQPARIPGRTSSSTGTRMSGGRSRPNVDYQGRRWDFAQLLHCGSNNGTKATRH